MKKIFNKKGWRFRSALSSASASSSNNSNDERSEHIPGANTNSTGQLIQKSNKNSQNIKKKSGTSIQNAQAATIPDEHYSTSTLHSETDGVDIKSRRVNGVGDCDGDSLSDSVSDSVNSSLLKKSHINNGSRHFRTGARYTKAYGNEKKTNMSEINKPSQHVYFSDSGNDDSTTLHGSSIYSSENFDGCENIDDILKFESIVRKDFYPAAPPKKHRIGPKYKSFGNAKATPKNKLDERSESSEDDYYNRLYSGNYESRQDFETMLSKLEYNSLGNEYSTRQIARVLNSNGIQCIGGNGTKVSISRDTDLSTLDFYYVV
ncbi:hypothetical protein AX774_g7951 [Zancudomyces culisetae]|uniref:Uncharacterized protein n=1 Tax=Zancudomyces culisetae TaxID=1213189 RepID=A0A1R1PCG2_ZANCU|nr:hypothetical protein AX774_g7951 [Zancudomyces culisetae]|eukprot:OMH78654.1 hypothetical protein AX774_g7951 [Zancudomyces culisetae]